MADRKGDKDELEALIKALFIGMGKNIDEGLKAIFGEGVEFTWIVVKEESEGEAGTFYMSSMEPEKQIIAMENIIEKIKVEGTLETARLQINDGENLH